MQTGICTEGTSTLMDFTENDEQGSTLDIAQVDTDEGLLDITQETEPQRELSFSEKLICLEEAVTRHPLNREVLYAILRYCNTEHALSDVEEFIAGLPQFKTATQNQYRMIETLQKAYGLEAIEYDVEGRSVDPEIKATLTEDEIDDLIVSVSFQTTEVGNRFVEQHHPKARIAELFDLSPERAEAYKDVLAFIEQSPRTYHEVSAFLDGSPALETEIDGRLTTMQPSVFLDKLERAGALVWNEKWELTMEGGDFLDELK